jgi:1-aminocyclopropane-1-carboxylate deaminase/D-cysteine desulfhydrase-like pyridoxal-dependent ACC family enzyme
MIAHPGIVAGKIRAALGPRSLAQWPTPLEEAPALAAATGVDRLWIKREDAAGGSKTRGLEFLLADAPPGTVFVTIGGTGSTHCLATALHAARAGGRAIVAQFPQPHTPDAAHVAAATLAHADAVFRSRSTAGFPAALWSAWHRAGQLGTRRWIPGGGAHPRAVVGHVLAGLELPERLSDPPDAIVVPLGSTGTAAGLSLAMSALGWPTRVIAVRVAPVMVANRWRAARLAGQARRVLSRVIGVPPPQAIIVINGLGQGYGHPTDAGERARELGLRHGLPLDSTYSAKAFAALAEVSRRGFRRVVFWHTFARPPAVEPVP